MRFFGWPLHATDWRLGFLVGLAIVAACRPTALGPECPPGLCGTDQRCEGLGVDSPVWACCGAPGTMAMGGTCCSAVNLADGGVDEGGLCECIPTFARAQCLSNSDCCSGRCWEFSPGWSKCVPKGTGSSCDSGIDCLSNICTGGSCACTPTLRGYMACYSNSECCSGVCDGYCK